MTTLEVLLFTFFGGLAINLIRLYDLQDQPPANQKALKNPVYWLQFITTPAIASGLAYAYFVSGVSLNAILCVQIGASAPLILKSFASMAPSVGNEKVG